MLDLAASEQAERTDQPATQDVGLHKWSDSERRVRFSAARLWKSAVHVHRCRTTELSDRRWQRAQAMPNDVHKSDRVKTETLSGGLSPAILLGGIALVIHCHLNSTHILGDKVVNPAHHSGKRVASKTVDER